MDTVINKCLLQLSYSNFTLSDIYNIYSLADNFQPIYPFFLKISIRNKLFQVLSHLICTFLQLRHKILPYVDIIICAFLPNLFLAFAENRLAESNSWTILYFADVLSAAHVLDLVFDLNYSVFDYIRYV